MATFSGQTVHVIYGSYIRDAATYNIVELATYPYDSRLLVTVEIYS